MVTLNELSEKRIFIEEVFKGKKENVEIAGWVDSVRELGKIRFLVLRDASGMIQVTAVKDKVKKEVFEALGKIPRESVVFVKGSVKDAKQAPGGKEIVPEQLEVLNKAEENLPIDVSDFSKTELAKRLDFRFLDFHRKRIQAIFKI